MEKIMFKGIMPALPTPINKDEKLIYHTVGELIDFEYSKGVNGFYVGGATGEGPVLRKEVRMELCEAAVEANRGRGKIIVHVGGPNFSDVKELVRHADKSGADAVSAMAPNAYYSHTDSEIVSYYKAIASMTDKPVLIYVTHLMLNNNLEKVFNELLSVKNIIGMKFTQKDYYRLSLLKMLNGGNVNVINGPDEMLISGLAMGADGGIGSTYNIMAEKFVAVYDLFKNGEIDAARAKQYEINRIVRVLLEYGTGGALKNTKAALELMGFEMGGCVYPTSELDNTEKAGLKKALEAVGIIF